jgi:H+/Cl- antiporter ClcA
VPATRARRLRVAIDETRPRFYLHVIAIAVIGGFVVMGWLALYTLFTDHVWYSSWVTSHRWIFPFICLPFSLIVGLLVKHFNAPTNLQGSMIDSLNGGADEIDGRRLPVTIAQSYASLFSGAALGPEGGIGAIASQLAALYNEKLKIPAVERSKIIFGSVSSAYNGLLENPVFTGVLATELQERKASQSTLPANLLGGAVGYCVFLILHGTGLANFFHLAPVSTFEVQDVLWVVLLALAGMAIAVITGVMMKVSAAIFGRLADRPVERALAAGVVFSIVGTFAPIVMFSGEDQVLTVVGDPTHYGMALLVVMAFGKLALLSVAFKSGFLGGPTFPSVFACVCIAEAINIAIPGLALPIVIAAVLAGFLMVLFKTPFMVVLLISFMLGASANLIALIVFAVATALIVAPVLQRLIAARQGASAGGGSP